MLFPEKWIIVLLCCLNLLAGCSDSKQEVVSVDSYEVSTLPAEAKLNQMNLSKARGQLLFKSAPTGNQKLTAFSVEQPDTKLKTISKDVHALLELIPQKHTLVATLESDDEKSWAVIPNIPIEAGQIFDLGLIPFEKSGRLRGRVLLASDSSPLADAVVQIPQLNRQTKTNANGEFDFDGMAPGSWKMTIKKPGQGALSDVDVDVVSNKTSDAGDFWLGDSQLSELRAIVKNAKQGLVSERKATLELRLPSAARWVAVKSASGDVLLERTPARASLDVHLTNTGLNHLRVFVYDSRGRILGVLSTAVDFDPFMTVGTRYLPRVKISERVIVSPARTINVMLEDIPVNATQVRLSLDDEPGEWSTPSPQMSFEIPKSNSMCGNHELNVQYQTAGAEQSSVTRVPVTLSCWRRIPHRGMVDKMVGLDNASVWTGTHVFVWSGKQISTSNRSMYFAGGNSAENQTQLDALQKYTYFDGGYVYKPVYNDTFEDLDAAVMESIVTDNAPASRSLPGAAGSGNLVAIYGGERDGQPLADGAFFDIARNGWVSMNGEGAPSPRIKPSVFFISAKKILVWGGRSKTNLGYDLPLNDGAIYDTELHTWTPMNSVGAPSARMLHVGVWTGSEFVVLGGQLPGSVEVYSGARFNPASNSWTSTATLTTPMTFMSALHNGDDIVLYGRNNLGVLFSLSQNKQIQSTQFDVGGWNVNPALVLDGNGSGATGSKLYIFGGRSSFNGTDASENLVRLNYRPGVIENSGDVFSSIFAARGLIPSVNGQRLENCCVDMLGFVFNSRIFAMNGTSVTNYSVYTTFQENANTYGQKYHTTDSVPAYKGSQSYAFYDDGSGLTVRQLDVPPDNDTYDYAPVGPHNYFWAHSPVWSATERSLLWYGGKYRNLIGEAYQSGGFVYNIDQMKWKAIPPPASEPSYIDSQGKTRTYSRFNPWSFFLNGKFYVLAGLRADNGVHFQHDGFAIPFSGGSLQTAQQILTSPTDVFDYVPRDTSAYANKRWDPNPECVVGNSVFLSGGRRQEARTIAGQLKDSAMVEQKVVFDATTNSLRMVSTDPLGHRAGTSVVSMGSTCFLWGGYTADGAKLKDTEANTTADIVSRFAAQNSGYIFTPGTDAWTQLPTVGAPSPRAFMHSVWTGKDVLLWGGTENTAPRLDANVAKLKGVYRFTPSENRWTALPATENEPIFTGYERPVWTGTRMLIWKTPDAESSFEYDPERNQWTRLPAPYGFGLRYNNFYDSNVTWLGDRLFVMPYRDKVLGVMALYVPPNL